MNNTFNMDLRKYRKFLSLAALFILFMISFLIKINPLYKGYNVPYGVVDTSFHISSALDLSEGNFKSLVHPWWHLKNHILLDGLDVVDRNATTFFYPPFLHLILAVGFLFFPPEASIIIISLLYSLSVIAVYLLCKSFKLKDSSALISSALITFSIPLVYSQTYGFWTFLIAFNFLILSYSLLRFKSRKLTWISLLFYLLALTTHWTFFFFAALLGLVELFIAKNKEARLYLFSITIITAPFYTLLFNFANPLSYIAVHFSEIHLPNSALIMLSSIGFFLGIKKYKEMSIFTILILILSLSYYIFGFKFIFGDMVQFVYPFLVSFYTASLFGLVKARISKIIFLILIAVISIHSAISMQKLLVSTKASISKEEFNALMRLRTEFKSDDNTILSIDRGLFPWWITVVSKNSKIIYPDTYEKENMDKYKRDYIYNVIDKSKGYNFYKITKKNGNLTLERNVNLPKQSFIN